MIIVKICCGTVCHVMGGSDLPLVADFLPEEIKSKVKIEGTPCLGFCNRSGAHKPPFVTVNGIMISEATFAKIIDHIKLELN